MQEVNYSNGGIRKSRLDKKSANRFLSQLECFNLLITQAYQINKEVYKESEVDWKLHKQVNRIIGNALVIFADTTEWLADKQKSKRKKPKILDAERLWVDASKTLLGALSDLTSMYTNYKESLGMVNGNMDIPSVFREIDFEEFCGHFCQPYGIDFSSIFCQAAEILFNNGRLTLARRFALISAMEDIWNGEWRDSQDALTLIYLKFYHNKQYELAIVELIRTLKWLYLLNKGWQDQLPTSRIIKELQYYFIDDWKLANEATRAQMVDFLRVAIKKEPYFDDVEYVLSIVIDSLVCARQYDNAFKVVLEQITILAKEPADEHNFKLLKKMALLGFSLKDKNIESITKSNDNLKGSYLENKVCELAQMLGYPETGERIWNYKDESLKSFLKDSATKSVEIDVNRHKAEFPNGKEKKVLFLAECKWRNKPIGLKDIAFFRAKIADLIQQTAEDVKKYPTKTAPRLGEVWFVSVSGFVPQVLNQKFVVKGLEIKLMDGKRLNELLTTHNIKTVHLDTVPKLEVNKQSEG